MFVFFLYAALMDLIRIDGWIVVLCAFCNLDFFFCNFYMMLRRPLKEVIGYVVWKISN